MSNEQDSGGLFAVTPIVIRPDGRLDTKNAALYCGLTKGTLANMRSLGSGPKFYKREGGKSIWYFKRDLDAWLLEGGSGASTAQARVRAGARLPALLRKRTSSEATAEAAQA